MRLLVSLILVGVMVGGCASPASHFNADIANSSSVCKGRPIKSQVEWVQCLDAVERPIVFKDIPNLLYAYDIFSSARLSAANDYDNQVRPAREKALATLKSQIDASQKRLNQALTGIWPQTQTDRDSIEQEMDKASSQCSKDGIYKSNSLVAGYKCAQDARFPVVESRVPAATSAYLATYNEQRAIAADYDRAVLAAKQAADVKFRTMIVSPRNALQSQVQLALQNDAAATARQQQEAADNAATLLMLLTAGVSGFNQGRGYDQPSHPPISASCTTTHGITNCLSF